MLVPSVLLCWGSVVASGSSYQVGLPIPASCCCRSRTSVIMACIMLSTSSQVQSPGLVLRYRVSDPRLRGLGIWCSGEVGGQRFFSISWWMQGQWWFFLSGLPGVRTYQKLFNFAAGAGQFAVASAEADRLHLVVPGTASWYAMVRVAPPFQKVKQTTLVRGDGWVGSMCAKPQLIVESLNDSVAVAGQSQVAGH